MIRTKLTKLHISPISLHSASYVRIPSSVNNFGEMLLTICYRYIIPVKSTIFNFNKIVTDIDIDSNTPDS